MDSEKCSRRRLPKTTSPRLEIRENRSPNTRRRRRLAAAIVCAALPLMPALPAAAETEPRAVAALNRFLETVDTLEAEFRQRIHDADGVLLERARGSFALARPDRFVWHYRTPNEQILLADGERLWMYDLELEQATVSPLEESAGSPAMLLSGDAPVLESFDVESSFERDGLAWVRLVPKLEDADFRSVAIGFDDEGLPTELELVDGLDQTTRIEFSGIVVNEALDDDVFELDLPDEVDVIGAEG